MKLELTPRTWLALVALGPAIFFAIQLLPLLRSLFLLLLVTALVALLIVPLADRLERRGISRGLTTGLALGGALAVLFGLLLLVLPALFGSLGRLADNLAALALRFEAQIVAITGSAEVAAVGDLLVSKTDEAIRWAIAQLGTTLGQIGVIGFAAFVSAVCIFALVGDKGTGPALLNAFVPRQHHARVTSLVAAASVGLSRWFVAQCAICGYYAIAYSLALFVVGAPFAVQIGVVSGLLEFIPYLGGLVGMVLSIVAAATVSPTAVLIVLAIEAVIGAVAVSFVVPYAFAKAVDVPAALILLGLFVGGLIGGFFAALLTVPLLAVALVVYRQLRGGAPATSERGEPAPRPAAD